MAASASSVFLADPFQQISLASPKSVDVFPPLGRRLKALMVWPRFPPSFWGFEGVLEMVAREVGDAPAGADYGGGALPGGLEYPAAGYGVSDAVG